jgi:UDP-N-acetylglucosamine 3-dehydrogenase
MIRVGVAGTGSMGRTHALALATIPDATVAAVLDDDPVHAASLAARVGARPYTDLEIMLATEGLDAVDCCLPTPLHRRLVERAAAAGCHVICEKPIAPTIADGLVMIEACRAAGTHLLMAQVVRFFPEYRRLARALREGQIGRPVSLTTLRQSAYPTGRRGWFRDESMSGGIVLDQMIHDFDWTLQQLGPAERVYARLVQRWEPRPFAQGMATVRHASGAISLITSTWGHPGPFTTMVELAGDGGLLRYHSADSAPVQVSLLAGAGKEEDVPLPELGMTEDPYRAQLAHFVEVIAGRAGPLIRPEEALAALALALAARASARANQPQAVEAPL